MPTKAPFIVVGTILLSVFALMAFSGLVIVYQFEWCQSGEFCNEAWKALAAAMELALIDSIAATFCFWGLRAKLPHKRVAELVAIGLVTSLLLFLMLIFGGAIKDALAAQFFPYVTALRFGLLGRIIFWGASSLIICAAVMAVVVRVDNLTIRSREDAP